MLSCSGQPNTNAIRLLPGEADAGSIRGCAVCRPDDDDGRRPRGGRLGSGPRPGRRGPEEGAADRRTQRPTLGDPHPLPREAGSDRPVP